MFRYFTIDDSTLYFFITQLILVTVFHFVKSAMLVRRMDVHYNSSVSNVVKSMNPNTE